MKKNLPYLLLLLTFAYTGSIISQDVSGLIFTTSSNEAKSYFSQGLKYADAGDQRRAREAFGRAIEQDPKLAVAYIYKANYAITPQEFADNLKMAKQNLSTASDWEKLFYEFTASYLNDDMNKRLAATEKMVQLFPEMARSYLYLGEAYSSEKNYEKARQQYLKAIELEPTWPMSYAALTNSYLFDSPTDFAKAEEMANKLLTLSPTAQAQILLGDVYRAQNNLQKASEAYKKAVELDKESPVAFYKSGHAHTFMGEYEQARSDYEQAGKLDVMPTFSKQCIANTFLYQDQPAQALKIMLDEAAQAVYLEDAAKITSARYDLLSAAAQIAFHMKDADQLQSILESLKPLSEETGRTLGSEEARLNQKSNVLYWKGMIKALKGDYKNATAKAEEIKTLLQPIQNPRKLESYHELMGFISYSEKDFAKATEHFAKTNLQNMYNKYWLAKAYESAGQKEEATTLYKEIANYNFNNIGYALVRSEVIKKI